MKKILIFFLLLIQANIFAQSFNSGVITGITASEISGDQYAGPNKPGPILGVFVNHKINETSAIQMEMYYVQKGSRKNPNTKMNDFTKYVLHINYIEIPLIYIFKPFKKIRPELGIASAIHFSDKERDEYGIVYRQSSVPKFKPYDFSPILGINYFFSEKLAIHFRYSTSLFVVRQHNGGGSVYYNKGQYNSVWYLTLHYTFKASEK